MPQQTSTNVVTIVSLRCVVDVAWNMILMLQRKFSIPNSDIGVIVCIFFWCCKSWFLMLQLLFINIATNRLIKKIRSDVHALVVPFAEHNWYLTSQTMTKGCLWELYSNFSNSTPRSPCQICPAPTTLNQKTQKKKELVPTPYFSRRSTRDAPKTHVIDTLMELG